MSHFIKAFTAQDSKLCFQINASESRPIHNLCFEIGNWGMNRSAGLAVIGKVLTNGSDFRQGKIIDSDGKYKMIIWILLNSTSPNSFEIIKN